ncbi:lipoate protein ligase A [Streptococcus pneumoniae]|nr:lipoate protein ligase A [Streptococcus pneumoniae]
MKYIINHSNDTAFNIALEEYAFKHLLDEDQIFLLWINKPSIIVGRHQNTIEEINRDYVRENGIEVVRRISGGGAVYHDLNNLNYTIISKEDENKAFDFKSFSTPVINTLAQLGVKAEFTGRNDLRLMVRSSVAMPKPISTAVSCTTVACSLTLICQSSQMPLRFQKINLNQKV